MRLLTLDKDGKPSFTDDLEDNIPLYAILSHTWGKDEEEVTYSDIVNGIGRQKAGYNKITFCAEQAKRDGLHHFWIDTCCINKKNKAELTRSLNSMFLWYGNATRCYVYLSDVSYTPNPSTSVSPPSPWEPALRDSQWFKRGWTLQELLAPSRVEFFSTEGTLLGNKTSLELLVHEVTGIAGGALRGEPLFGFHVEERFTWAIGRVTKLEEDRAYSLLGIFGVYIAPDYGEGRSRAMERLRKAIDERDRYLNDLQTTDPGKDKRRIEEAKGGLLRDSYRWILENRDFQQWLADPNSMLLWIKGDPGKGKTMLLCGIINELKKTNGKSCCVSYFFCQATDVRINRATSVLRGLLYILVQEQPFLMNHVQKELGQAGKSGIEDANSWITLHDIFTAILQDPALKTTCFVIDALDECVEDLPKLLGFIAQTSSLSPRVKWIVSSRNWPEIEGGLKVAKHKAMLCLEMNVDAIDSAVASYIQHRVRQLCQQKDFDDEMAAGIENYLLANADGTFLWVSLVCQELVNIKTTKRNAMLKLHSFPSGLDPLYGRMMDQIRDSDDANLCKQILAIAATVRRPVTLLELLAIGQREGVEDLEALTEVISLCGSFLTIRNNNVYFVHQSAKDFLLSKAFMEIFPDGLGEVHRQIYSSSLDILRPILKRDMYNLLAPGFPINEVQVPDPDPLGSVRYSCLHWVDHLCDAISDKSRIIADDLQDGSAVDTFLRGKFLYWLEGLSLLHGLSEGVIAITRLHGLLANTQECGLAALVRDVRRFMMAHKAIIEKAPLQAYVSALLFSPSGSIVRQLFQVEEPRWIKTKPAVEEDWNACLQTLEGHSGSVWSIAFTHDSRQLASGSYDKTIKLWDIASGQCLQTLYTGTWTTDLAFDSTGDYLLTSHGRVRIQPSIAADRIDVTRDTTITRNIQELGAEQVICSGYGIDRQKVWVTLNGRNIVWLPPDYRPVFHTWRGSALGCGSPTGRVFLLSFQESSDPFRDST